MHFFLFCLCLALSAGIHFPPLFLPTNTMSSCRDSVSALQILSNIKHTNFRPPPPFSNRLHAQTPSYDSDTGWTREVRLKTYFFKK